jgi:methyltransferase (TIGR00027 family)
MPVQKTNDWMCAVRARETARPDAVISDPYAHILAGDSDLETATHFHPDHGGILLRRRFTDDVLAEAVAAGTRQVASLGSGWDTRPYFETMPQNLHYYEVDLPGQVAGRDALLAEAGISPSCQVHTIEADLRSPDWPKALLRAGYDHTMPIVWIAEGIFYYLEPDNLYDVMSDLSKISAPGSRISFDAFDPEFYSSPLTLGLRALVEHVGAKFYSAIGDPSSFLDGYGWSAEAYRADEIARGRCPWLPEPPQRVLAGADFTWFVRGRKR